jgi:hypothetical protein
MLPALQAWRPGSAEARITFHEKNLDVGNKHKNADFCISEQRFSVVICRQYPDALDLDN